MYPENHALAQKFIRSMAQELGRELIRKNKDAAAIRRILRVQHIAQQISESVTQTSKASLPCNSARKE